MSNISDDAVAIAAAGLVQAAMSEPDGDALKVGGDAVIGSGRADRVEKLYARYVTFVRKHADTR